jgi:hypothetical protein
MRDASDVRRDRGAVEEAAIGEEDAEGIDALDDETIILPRLGSCMGQDEQTAFHETEATAIRDELGRAVQSPGLAAPHVPDAADERPASRENRGYRGQTSGSIICSKVQGQARGNPVPKSPVSASASMTASS